MILPVINPTLLMLIAMGITAMAGLASWLVRRRHRRTIHALAEQWAMHYSPEDCFGLAARVAGHLPVAGAADVRCRDLIYGNEPTGHRCIFSAEFTVGIVRAKSRRQCVISVIEPPTRGESTGWLSLRIAPDDLPLLEQYGSLR